MNEKIYPRDFYQEAEEFTRPFLERCIFISSLARSRLMIFSKLDGADEISISGELILEVDPPFKKLSQQYVRAITFFHGMAIT